MDSAELLKEFAPVDIIYYCCHHPRTKDVIFIHLFIIDLWPGI